MPLPARRVPALVTLAAIAACSGSEKPPAATPAAQQAAAPTPTVVTITASDFAFEMPDTIAGGMVTLRLVNKGPGIHHASLVRLSDGKTLADFAASLKAMKPTDALPPWAHEEAGPNVPTPGSEQSITQNLQPGNYAVICWVDVPDKVPHVMKGMMHPLTVTAPAGALAAVPAADVSVTMRDYAWDVAPALSAGKHVLKITNVAAQTHELVLIKLAAGKTAADLMRWGKDYKGPLPGTAAGGVSGMAPGVEAYLALDLTPGDYVMLCFVPDAKDGKPHAMHGMVAPIKVS